MTYRGIEVGPRVDHLIEQVVSLAIRQAALGVIAVLTFDDVSAPSFAPAGKQLDLVRAVPPTRPGHGAAVQVFEGADEAHRVEGLTLKHVVINGHHLRDVATARRVANLSVGPYVRRRELRVKGHPARRGSAGRSPRRGAAMSISADPCSTPE